MQREYAEPQLDKIAEATHQPPPPTNSFQRQESLANKSSESKGIELIHTESEERKILEHYSMKYVPRIHIFLSYVFDHSEIAILLTTLHGDLSEKRWPPYKLQKISYEDMN